MVEAYRAEASGRASVRKTLVWPFSERLRFQVLSRLGVERSRFAGALLRHAGGPASGLCYRVCDVRDGIQISRTAVGGGRRSLRHGHFSGERSQPFQWRLHGGLHLAVGDSAVAARVRSGGAGRKCETNRLSRASKFRPLTHLPAREHTGASRSSAMAFDTIGWVQTSTMSDRDGCGSGLRRRGHGVP